MKVVFTIALFISSLVSYCQIYNFSPNWKVGDSKKISITQAESEFENGKLIASTSTNNEAEIKVLKVTADSYLVEITMENQAMIAAASFYEKLGEELKEYRDLRLLYQVNRSTAKAELQNWEEVKDFIDKSFEQITSLLEEKVPDEAFFVGLVFMPIKEIFKSKENVEAYVQESIGFLLSPFNKDFKLGETLTVVEISNNPFKPTEKIEVTNLFTLESVDTQSKVCTINHETKIDLSKFIEMMRSMMMKMAESMGVDEEDTAKKTQELDEFNLDMKSNQVITFDYNSTWVTKVVTTGIVTGSDPIKKVESRREVITTTEVR
jgi:hypothetical protein